MKPNSPVIVMNPKAGGEIFTPDSLRELTGWEVRATEKAGDAGRMIQHLLETSPGRMVVVAGGDGTINEAIQGVGPHLENKDARKIKMGIIPLGTANDFCKSLGISDDVEAAISQIKKDKTCNLHIGKILLDRSTHYFLNAAAGGFVPDMSKIIDSEMKRWWGQYAYFRGGIEALIDAKPYQVCISDNEEKKKLKLWNLIVANGKYAGGGVKLAETADPTSGNFNVIVFSGENRSEFIQGSFKYFTNSGSPNENVIEFKSNEFSLTADGDFPIAADGEFLGKGSAIFKMMEQNVSFVCGDIAVGD